MPNISIPSQSDVENAIKSVFEELFSTDKSSGIDSAADNIEELSQRLNKILSRLTDNGGDLTKNFISNFENIKNLLLKDAQFILDSDPAATELIEVIAIYPGFFAIFCYRIANYLGKQNVPLLPRMITEYAHKITGIDIHPLADIGSPFSIDHGTGIVIGETTIIGNNVKMYQGVTLGALSVEKDRASKKRHPTINDNVILYAGCTILGGQTVIGRNSIIGGNVWITESIEPFSVVYHKSEVIVRNQHGYQEPINFVI